MFHASIPTTYLTILHLPINSLLLITEKYGTSTLECLQCGLLTRVHEATIRAIRTMGEVNSEATTKPLSLVHDLIHGR